MIRILRTSTYDKLVDELASVRGQLELIRTARSEASRRGNITRKERERQRILAKAAEMQRELVVCAETHGDMA